MPIDARNIQNYGLFKLFWNTHGDQDLSGGGLNEISVRGAHKLYDYALTHNLDGTDTPADRRIVDPDEKAVIKALLEDPHYGSFFEQDGRVKLIELFGLNAADIHPPADIVRPKPAGRIELGARASQYGEGQLSSVDPERLPAMFSAEYRQKGSFFEAFNATPEERSRRIVALLRDYSQALWSKDETPATEHIGNALLDEFEKTRSGRLLGSKNYNGAGWNVAQSLVLGLDPNAFETKFVDAKRAGEVTYLSMHGEMVGPMALADEWRAALGLQKKAAAYEMLSPLGWMIGEESGHMKKGNLDEQTPFASSGLNWGLVLFPGDAQISSLPPKDGFEFPIDCLDGFSNFIVCRPAQGDRLLVKDERGNTLQVVKEIQAQNGKDLSWTAKFLDAAGQPVDPSKVLGVIVDRNGRVKGDGKATGSVNMWWWGFCDRNTAQALYKTKFDIPQLEREEIKVKAGGKMITLPKAEAQKLLDCDIPDIVTNPTMSAFRFNGNPKRVMLKNGQGLDASVGQEVFDSGAALRRISGDVVSVHDGPGRPLLGGVELKTQNGSETIAAKDIVSITKDLDSSHVVVKVQNQWRDTIEGELVTAVPFDRAVRENNKLVLAQTPDYAIRGAVGMTLADGTVKTVPVEQIEYITGETQRDVRLSQFAVWVSHNNGMFATDSAIGEVVSNGMRWVNKIDQDVREGEDRPDWAPKGELDGIEGKMIRMPGDRLVWMRGLFAYNPGTEPDSTAFAGWVQLSKDGRIVNEGFTEQQPDFGWSAAGPLNWLAASTFNPYLDPELRVAILVNGLNARGAELEAIAKRLNLPANYVSYLVDA